MKKNEERFDCVEMMHRGGQRVHEALKEMTREEQLAYWRRMDEEARIKHPRLRIMQEAETSRQ